MTYRSRPRQPEVEYANLPLLSKSRVVDRTPLLGYRLLEGKRTRCHFRLREVSIR